MKKHEIINVRIDNLVFGGQGIGRVLISGEGSNANGESSKELVVFVDDVAPGDLVEVKAMKIKKNFVEGKVVKYLEFSKERVEARCKHFGQEIGKDGTVIIGDVTKECGGCSWQFLSGEKQLAIKEQIVKDSLIRLGKFPADLIEKITAPILGGEFLWNYRNKMDISFHRDIKVDPGSGAGMTGWKFGLHQKGSFFRICEISECHLAMGWVGDLVTMMRIFWDKNSSVDDGNFQSIIIRNGTNTGEVLINLIVENGRPAALKEWADEVQKFFAGKLLVGIVFTSTTNIKGSPKKFEEEILWGQNFYNEKMRIGDDLVLNFEVSASAFFQPNTKQAEVLYGEVLKMAELTGRETVYDLFCGTGTIGIALAGKAHEVIGIELNESAIESAKANAALNGVKNIRFEAGDVTKVLPALSQPSPPAPLPEGEGSGERETIVVLDPPRAGLNEKIIETVLAGAPQKIIYVSCNPTTQARDLEILCREKYQLVRVQPVDQFGQTYHVENIALLKII